MMNLGVNKGFPKRESPSPLKARIVEARSNSLGRPPLDYEMAIRTNYEQNRMTIERDYPCKQYDFENVNNNGI